MEPLQLPVQRAPSISFGEKHLGVKFSLYPLYMTAMGPDIHLPPPPTHTQFWIPSVLSLVSPNLHSLIEEENPPKD